MTKGLIFIFDHIDFAILALLRENSRIQWKDIGQKIHMTGQAVGNRIRRLEDLGVIEQYTIVTNKAKLGLSITAFITFLWNQPIILYFRSS